MAVIYIDNKPYEAKPGKNLLESCLSLGFDLPYFCWHPAMGSVGACRQCAVKVFKDENDTRGKLMMSCMEVVKDNLRISIDDPDAKTFRKEVIEWLMTNHPHDCAICDEGGSCHLQDMTVMTGHSHRRYSYKKRTYTNQNLGPFLNHEMNRCIQCYRCVRFYKDYAGGKDLDVFAAHNHVYFGREKDGTLENEFSGNLAEVCPTGVFTDKTLKEHYTRKWDMTMAPSVCQHCSLGCNIIAGERYGQLRQITTKYNGEVNGYFICDRGRFGYEFVNSPNRIQQPLVRDRIPEAVDMRTIHHHIQDVLLNHSKVIGIGSPRASVESNFALMQLVGKDNFYQGIPDTEAHMVRVVLETLRSGNVHVSSLKETEQADVVLVLGEDPTNTAPRLALALRQAARKKPLEKAESEIHVPPWNDTALRERVQLEKEEVFIAYPTTTKLDEIATFSFHDSPDEIARLGFAIAHYLDEAIPLPTKLEKTSLDLAQRIALSLQSAKNPLIVSGTATYCESVLKAASNIAFALQTPESKASVFFVVPDCNSLGLAMMEAPSLDRARQALRSGEGDVMIVLENDLYRHGPVEEINELFYWPKEIIVLDHLNNPTTRKASILIPAGTFAEADGTLINNEGRAQRFFQVYMPKNEAVRESWRWLHEFQSLKSGVHPEELFAPGDLMAEVVQSMPQFKGAESVSPPPGFRIAGQRIPREPHRYSGRTAMLANENVSEPKPPEDTDSPLTFTMEGYKGIPPAPLIPFFWSPGWNSIQSINKFQVEIGGALHGGDPGRRLFEGLPMRETRYYNGIPGPYKSQANKFQVIPIYHIFGSEELSIYTPGVVERTPSPYIAISKVDAYNLKIGRGEMVHVEIGKSIYELTAEVSDELVSGIAGLPYNLPGMEGIQWMSKAILMKMVSRSTKTEENINKQFSESMRDKQ